MNNETEIRLGIMPLTDAAPLVIAEAKGFFAEANLRVTLLQEQSWATLRDKLLFGALDAAQMLAPMPLAVAFNFKSAKAPIVPMVLDLNGNGITVSSALLQEMRALAPHCLDERPIRATGLRAVVRERQRRALPKPVFGIVFPWSTHAIQLRWWLKDAKIDPDLEVDIVVVPPSQMADELRHGRLDGYCVGEPWNQLAVRAGIGHLLITSYELWRNGPEKVLAVNSGFAERQRERLQALLTALIKASAWLDRPDNRLEAARVLVEDGWVDAPIEVVGLSLMGVVADGLGLPRHLPDMHVFSRYAANFPWLSQALVLAQAMVDDRQLARLPAIVELQAIYRADLYRLAAEVAGHPAPLVDLKAEGGQRSSWTLERATSPIIMGPDSFIDGRIYPLPSRGGSELVGQ